MHVTIKPEKAEQQNLCAFGEAPFNRLLVLLPKTGRPDDSPGIVGFKIKDSWGCEIFYNFSREVVKTMAIGSDQPCRLIEPGDKVCMVSRKHWLTDSEVLRRGEGHSLVYPSADNRVFYAFAETSDDKWHIIGIGDSKRVAKAEGMKNIFQFYPFKNFKVLSRSQAIQQKYIEKEEYAVWDETAKQYRLESM